MELMDAVKKSRFGLAGCYHKNTLHLYNLADGSIVYFDRKYVTRWGNKETYVGFAPYTLTIRTVIETLLKCGRWLPISPRSNSRV